MLLHDIRPSLRTFSMNESVIDIAELHDQQEALRIGEELKRLLGSNGSAFYEPHRKQDLFHRSGDRKYRYVRTGNRWGKSQCGAAEDVAWARGFREWYPEGDEGRYAGIPQRSTIGCILVYDWGKALEIFTNQVDGAARGKLFDYIPKEDFLGVSKNNGGNIEAIHVKSKWGGTSSIHLDTVKSFIQNPMAHESSSWDWIHVDEPVPEDMWKAYARGLMDSNGKAWFLCTPLNQPWINDFFIPTRRTKLDVDSSTTFKNKTVIVGSTKDNPHITDEAREDFEELLTAEQIQCRLHGIPSAMTGMVYKNFSPEPTPYGHMYDKTPVGWKDEITPPEDYTIRYAIDPHPQTPHAVLFAATAPTGEVFFYREIFEQVDIEPLADQILGIVDGRLVMTSIADPAAFINNPVTGNTMADTLAAKGVVVEKAVKDLARGILSTQAALKKKMPEGHYWLNFHGGLYRTLWEFDHYQWDEKRPNKPVDKDDHMMENLYRLILNGLEWIDPDDTEGMYFPQADPSNVSYQIPHPDGVRFSEERIARMSPEERYELYRLGAIQ